MLGSAIGVAFLTITYPWKFWELCLLLRFCARLSQVLALVIPSRLVGMLWGKWKYADVLAGPHTFFGIVDADTMVIGPFASSVETVAMMRPLRSNKPHREYVMDTSNSESC